MERDRQNELKRKFNIYVSTCQYTPNPVDDEAGWRRRWAELLVLADEITAFAAEND